MRPTAKFASFASEPYAPIGVWYLAPSAFSIFLSVWLCISCTIEYSVIKMWVWVMTYDLQVHLISGKLITKLTILDKYEFKYLRFQDIKTVIYVSIHILRSFACWSRENNWIGVIIPGIHAKATGKRMCGIMVAIFRANTVNLTFTYFRNLRKTVLPGEAQLRLQPWYCMTTISATLGAIASISPCNRKPCCSHFIKKGDKTFNTKWWL